MYDGTLDTGLIPLKMCSAVATLNQYLPGWNLADIELTERPPPRSFVYDVSFDYPFTNIPLVQTGITGFDIGNNDTARVRVKTQEISTEGFKMVIESWMHTRVYQVEVSWFAIGNT